MHHPDAESHNPHLRNFTSTAGVVLSEMAYPGDERLPAHAHEENAYFTLVIDGGFAVESAWRSCEVAASELILQRAGESRANRFGRLPSLLFNVGLDAQLQKLLHGALAASTKLQSTSAADLMRELRRELHALDDLSPLVIEGVALELIAVSRRAAAGRRDVPPPWLRRVRERIHDDLPSRIALESLAAESGVHVVHVARAFRESFGCSIGDYVRRRRLIVACGHLLRTDENVADIAANSGFFDESHLTHAFRRILFTTPAAFRKKRRNADSYRSMFNSYKR